MGGAQTFILIMAAVFIGVILLAVIVKMREVRVASKWPQTIGEIVESAIEAREKSNMDGATTTANYPSIVYKYEVQGKEYIGKRISVGEQAPDFELQATIAKYPVGRTVPVYYNPGNPKDAVLERDLPPDFGKGLSCILLFFVIGAVVFAVGVDRIPQLIGKIFANAEDDRLVALIGGMGMFTALLTLVMELQVRATLKWPYAPGRIVSAGVQKYREGGVGARGPMYRSKVVYKYQVAGNNYKSDQVSLGMVTSWNSAMAAGKATSKYKAGDAIQVYYNPDKPSEAVLERNFKGRYILWALAAGLLALALKVALGSH